VNTAIKTKPWKGLLASLLLPGAGQFLSGARRRGIIWFLIIGALPLFLLSFYSLPFVPAKSAIWLLAVTLIAWLTMLCDSYRPIAQIRWRSWALLIVLSFALSEMSSALTHRLFAAYHAPTEAMAPTIKNGDDILICRVAYWFREPRRGDLVVFSSGGIKSIRKNESGRGVLSLKRLIALPNDIVEIGGGDVWVNKIKMIFGDPTHAIEYRKVQGGILPGAADSYVVPGGEYFVLGDNSAHSYDSRYWGTIRRSAIAGKVVKVYWPWSRMSTPQ
jgi:signal peptidase I